jgi:hypothetical protein
MSKHSRRTTEKKSRKTRRKRSASRSAKSTRSSRSSKSVRSPQKLSGGAWWCPSFIGACRQKEIDDLNRFKQARKLALDYYEFLERVLPSYHFTPGLNGIYKDKYKLDDGKCSLKTQEESQYNINACTKKWIQFSQDLKPLLFRHAYLSVINDSLGKLSRLKDISSFTVKQFEQHTVDFPNGEIVTLSDGKRVKITIKGSHEKTVHTYQHTDYFTDPNYFEGYVYLTLLDEKIVRSGPLSGQEYPKNDYDKDDYYRYSEMGFRKDERIIFVEIEEGGKKPFRTFRMFHHDIQQFSVKMPKFEQINFE